MGATAGAFFGSTRETAWLATTNVCEPGRCFQVFVLAYVHAGYDGERRRTGSELLSYVQ
jgi:hypothetical protein